MATARLSPAFKIVLIAVLVFTTLSFAASIALAWAPASKTTEQIFEVTVTTFKLGFGALVGLLSGKAV